MKEISVLPADIFVVVNRTIMNDKDRKIINMLYQPILGVVATGLYYTLWSDLDKTELMSMEYNHHHLMMAMRMKLDAIMIARKKLEAAGLLKTYVKQNDNVNSYIYELFAPISASEFFNHPVLNVVLYNNLGKQEYEKTLEYFKVPHLNLNNYEDITSSFDEVFESTSGTAYDNLNEDIRINKTGDIKLDHAFDFDLLISSVPTGVITNKTFSKDAKELINNLSFVYNLDEMEMKGSILNAIKENGLIDKTLLRKNVKNYYRYENENKLPSLVYKSQPEYLKSPVGDDSKRAKMIYVFENTTPYNFLKGRNKGVKPLSKDLDLLETLLEDYKLNPGVVNVLIDYVLKINNKKLNRTYVETIALQWKRLKVETVLEAMDAAEKEYKGVKKERSYTKQSLKEETLPEWFDQKIEKKKITEEEEKSLQEMLKEFS